MPNIEPNLLAIAITTFAGFMLSYVWYSVLFAKAWKQEMGFENDAEPTGAALFKSLFLTLLGVLFVVFILSNNLQVWMPSSWGLDTPNMPVAQQAITATLFTWLGFFVPVQLNAVAWAKHSWKLFMINAGFYFVLLLLASFILLMMS